MLERLESLRADALQRVADATDAEALRALEKEFLGKEGVISEVLAAIPTLPAEERRDTGRGANELKGALQAAIVARKAELDEALVESLRDSGGFDPTLPPAAPLRGGLHPVTQVRRQVEAIFTSMGYEVLDGPEVELDYYNFQALNVPVDHPSRELQDTFYCDDSHTVVMRTQTSPVQIRAMERLEPPFRVIAPGRVFRNEEQDATHEHTFHQVEGLVVGEDIQVGHLTWTLRRLLNELFGRELEVRLRPGYFPFVEPGFEFDVRCPFCEEGCRVCSQSTWIEFCGCGMVQPCVLEAGFAGREDVDVASLTGFAFGFGLDRLVMMRFGIDDIRNLMGGDLRFLEQFPC